MRDQRANNDKLKKDFSVKAARHLEQVFIECAKEAAAARASASNHAVYITLKRYLSTFSPLTCAK